MGLLMAAAGAGADPTTLRCALFVILLLSSCHYHLFGVVITQAQSTDTSTNIPTSTTTSMAEPEPIPESMSATMSTTTSTPTTTSPMTGTIMPIPTSTTTSMPESEIMSATLSTATSTPTTTSPMTGTIMPIPTSTTTSMPESEIMSATLSTATSTPTTTSPMTGTIMPTVAMSTATTTIVPTNTTTATPEPTGLSSSSPSPANSTSTSSDWILKEVTIENLSVYYGNVTGLLRREQVLPVFDLTKLWFERSYDLSQQKNSTTPDDEYDDKGNLRPSNPAYAGIFGMMTNFTYHGQQQQDPNGIKLYYNQYLSYYEYDEGNSNDASDNLDNILPVYTFTPEELVMIPYKYNKTNENLTETLRSKIPGFEYLVSPHSIPIIPMDGDGNQTSESTTEPTTTNTQKPTTTRPSAVSVPAVCSICPPGSSMGNPERDLVIMDGTCGELQSRLNLLDYNADECLAYLGAAPFIELSAFCGCTSVSTPNLCQICSNGGDLLTSSEAYDIKEVTIPGLDMGLKLKCNQAAKIAPYLTQTWICGSVSSAVDPTCCSTPPYSDGIRVPDPSVSSQTCSVCPVGSKMERPNREVLITPGVKCGELEDDATTCSILSAENTMYDVAAYCGCTGAGLPNLCMACEVGESVSEANAEKEVLIPTLNKAFDCEVAVTLPLFAANEAVCDKMISAIRPECCSKTSVTDVSSSSPISSSFLIIFTTATVITVHYLFP